MSWFNVSFLEERYKHTKMLIELTPSLQNVETFVPTPFLEWLVQNPERREMCKNLSSTIVVLILESLMSSIPAIWSWFHPTNPTNPTNPRIGPRMPQPLEQFSIDALDYNYILDLNIFNTVFNSGAFLSVIFCSVILISYNNLSSYIGHNYDFFSNDFISVFYS